MTSHARDLVSSPSWGHLASWLEEVRCRWSGRRGDPSPRSWRLPDDGTLGLRPGVRGLALRCASGCVVVTQERDPLDHVLGAGEEFRTAARGRVVVWALRGGEVVASLPALEERAVPAVG